MAKLIVDGIEIDVAPELTLLQACEAAGAEIPRFCYHERLSVAGNCRMCLVEVKGGPPKPTASCGMNVRDLRPGPNGEPPVVLTNSPMVKKAREGVMEFLLINHPLDCPICDQGGECDLQDQAMAYGVSGSRFIENKRAVEDKYLGPLVKTSMNRCIHCTRCVRFTTEVAGIAEMGLISRGEDAEITSYLEKALSSELQGNVIDLCPVGALTSKPYAFHARPWELSKTESIDVMDAVGSAIRVDVRGREVMRVLPRLNESVNEEWISDKTRFIWDGLRTQRLDRPYVKADGRFRATSWSDAFTTIATRVTSTSPERMGAIVGDLASVEEMFALRELMAALGVASVDGRQDGTVLHPKFGRASYLFNATIAGIEEADAILMIGADPRHEAAVMNARIRKRWRASGGKLPVYTIGVPVDLTYPHVQLGTDPAALQHLDASAFETLKAAQKPLIIVGQGALIRHDGLALLSLAAKLASDVGAITEGWNGFSVLHTAASRVGALDLGLVPGEGGRDVAGMIDASTKGELDVLFLLGADEFGAQHLGPNTFVVYIGSHGDTGAHRADVILPGATYAEKSGTYVNTEGRVQLANRAAFPPGEAREDWAVLRALSEALGRKLPFDSLAQLRAKLYVAYPEFAAIDTIPAADPQAIATLAALGGIVRPEPFVSVITDFYLTNPIARASKVMAECSALARSGHSIAAE